MKDSASKCFVIMDMGDGSRAMRLAMNVARWISGRGPEAIVFDMVLNNSGNILRSITDVTQIVSHLGAQALRSYLSLDVTNSSSGGVVCDRIPEKDVFHKILDAYKLSIFVLGESSVDVVFRVCRGLPILFTINYADENSMVSAKRLMEKICALENGMTPLAFVLDSFSQRQAARLANRLNLASWGAEENLEQISLRMMETARDILFTSECKNKTTLDIETESAARKLLESLRNDDEFKEVKVPFGDSAAFARFKNNVAQVAGRLITEMGDAVSSRVDKEKLVSRVVDDSVGFGPIEILLADSSVSEIMINGAKKIYSEKNGVIELTPYQFFDNEQLMSVIDRMVVHTGRRIDESSPMVDARLPDGSRLNVIIPPLSIDGPVVTIRRFTKTIRSVDDVVATGMLSKEIADYLCECVKKRISIVVSGGTGAGKTTLLSILTSAIGPTERVITIEDSAELTLINPHVVRLESRPSNIEGSGAVTIRDLVKNALRMRPDRIVVGECRGAEVLDMLQAMNTGHEGSLTTVHANSSRDAITRLETMVMMAGSDLPLIVAREQIMRAIGLIVQVARLGDGKRRVIEISKISKSNDSEPKLQLVFESGGTCPQ